jgi:two-component system, chemotaxis family, protein-glutamate methylesterase/glutaminase
MLFSIPQDLPPDGIEAQTGMACPDCSGTLVMLVRKRFATFRCRVGHAYSLLEVVMGKEDMVERRLWETVASLEELADFLEIASRHRFQDLDPSVCQRRSTDARNHAQALRAVIDTERPFDGAAHDDTVSDAPGPAA